MRASFLQNPKTEYPGNFFWNAPRIPSENSWYLIFGPKISGGMVVIVDLTLKYITSGLINIRRKGHLDNEIDSLLPITVLSNYIERTVVP